MRIEECPRVRLAFLPTELEEMGRLRQVVGGPRLFVKRDDNTGLVLGGNKARKLEFLCGDALARGADVVVTVGAAQSNHARMTAAAARRLGMDVVLVLEGDCPGKWEGNLLLDRILGAEVRFSGSRRAEECAGEVSQELAAKGRKPYLIPVGGSNAVGVLGYVLAAWEILDQAERQGVRPSHVVVAAGSGGTHAGLLAGMKMRCPDVRVVGISVSRTREALCARVAELATAAMDMLGGKKSVSPDDVLVECGYIGPAYGVPTEEGLEAISLLARREGLLLDQVYTGKAMAGLIDLVKKGRFGGGEDVIFVHTGGVPALFALGDIWPVRSGLARKQRCDPS